MSQSRISIGFGFGFLVAFVATPPTIIVSASIVRADVIIASTVCLISAAVFLITCAWASSAAAFAAFASAAVALSAFASAAVTSFSICFARLSFGKLNEGWSVSFLYTNIIRLVGTVDNNGFHPLGICSLLVILSRICGILDSS